MSFESYRALSSSLIQAIEDASKVDQATEKITLEPWSDDAFNALALQIFQYQYGNNEIYRNYCEKLGLTHVSDYRDIPTVPTDVFKYAKITCRQRHTRIFRTSGTTQQERGAHYFHSLAYYQAAIPAPFKRYALPDFDKITMLFLVPPPEMLEDSSLSFMMGELHKRFGEEGSKFFVSIDEEGTMQFDYEGFHAKLLQAIEEDRPVFLLGTAFALVNYLDTYTKPITLPKGSRLIETGGLKGRSREISRIDMYDLFSERFGLPTHALLSEYSMSELSSQAYSDAWVRNVSWKDTHYRVPPWVRIEVIEPGTNTLIPSTTAPRRGILCWYDLANLDSVMAIQTSDLGKVFADGSFVLEGRASGSELRGCSLTAEEILLTQDSQKPSSSVKTDT